MKLKKYYENKNGEVKIGDLVIVTGSRDKDGIYIMTSNEINPPISQGAQRMRIRNNGKYSYCDHGNLSYQSGDENADVRIICNVFDLATIRAKDLNK